MSKGANYKFTQLFGYKGANQKILEEDIITVLKFDQTGKYLSLGDRAGRIIIFEYLQNGKKKDEKLEYLVEFQSHSKNFDPLKSVDVEEKIEAIQWLRPQGKYLKIITSNSRNIKLWKVFNQVQKRVAKSTDKNLSIPILQGYDEGYTAQQKILFPPKHVQDINSITGSYNGQYLLSSDKAQIFLWNYQNISKPFIVADFLQNQKMEDLEENINFSKMHPQSDNLFMFGTNKGSLKLCDLRQSAVSEGSALNFKNDMGTKSMITELISGYSSANFTKNNKYIVTRDLLTVKVWDICNSTKPVKTVCLNESLKSKISDMFENDCMDDSFEVSCSQDANTILTGSYNNSFHMVDFDGTNTQYELNFKKLTMKTNMGKQKAVKINKMDYLRKTTVVDFHPDKNFMAVAALNCFFTYGM